MSGNNFANASSSDDSSAPSPSSSDEANSINYKRKIDVVGVVDLSEETYKKQKVQHRKEQQRLAALDNP